MLRVGSLLIRAARQPLAKQVIAPAMMRNAEHEITTCTALWKAVVKLAHQAEVRPDSMPKTCLTLFYHNE
jgi:hypothetical protein